MHTSKLAEAAALLRAYEEANDEADDADMCSGGFESDPPGAEQRFREACDRLRMIRRQLFALGVHKGTEDVH